MTRSAHIGEQTARSLLAALGNHLHSGVLHNRRPKDVRLCGRALLGRWRWLGLLHPPRHLDLVVHMAGNVHRRLSHQQVHFGGPALGIVQNECSSAIRGLRLLNTAREGGGRWLFLFLGWRRWLLLRKYTDHSRERTGNGC